MNNTLGHRLHTSRKLAGLSLDELSEAINKRVSKQSLSKYEHGVMQPGLDTLSIISDALGVPSSYFVGHSMAINVPQLRRSVPQAATEEELREIESIILFYAERFRLKAKKTGIEVSFESPLGHFPVTTQQDIIRAAEALRQQWSCGDGVIPSILRVLERHGIWVFTTNLPEYVMGLSTWGDERYPLILLDVRKETSTVERLRFTAAHELAHLLLSFPEGADIERMCNKFASYFLLPPNTLIQEIGSRKRKELYLEELIDLHETYGVSIAALVHEAFDLEIISKEHYEFWFENIITPNRTEKGWGHYLFPETLGKEKRMDIIIANTTH